MNPESSHYQWTPKDKWLYWLSLVPFLVVFIGALDIAFNLFTLAGGARADFLPDHLCFPGWLLHRLSLSRKILPGFVWDLFWQYSLRDPLSQTGI